MSQLQGGARALYEKRKSDITWTEEISIGSVRLSYSLAIHDWSLILSPNREFLDIHPCGQGISFAVSLTHSCVEDNADSAQFKGLAPFKQSRVSRSKTHRSVPLEWLLWLHFKMPQLMSTFHILCNNLMDKGKYWCHFAENATLRNTSKVRGKVIWLQD